jgi:hypothetical protein
MQATSEADVSTYKVSVKNSVISPVSTFVFYFFDDQPRNVNE